MPREIPAQLWVSALLRRANGAGAFATIVNLGDAFERLAAEDEADVDALVAKRLKADRDLWVIEIEDREGRHFLTESVREG